MDSITTRLQKNIVAGEHLNISRDEVIFPVWEGQRLPLVKG